MTVAELSFEPMTREEALELTHEIRRGFIEWWDKVIDAYVRGAHIAMGYDKWDTYCQHEFDVERLGIPETVRASVLTAMTAAGMSHREISAGTGLGKATVGRTLRTVAGGPNGPLGNTRLPSPKPGPKPPVTPRVKPPVCDPPQQPREPPEEPDDLAVRRAALREGRYLRNPFSSLAIQLGSLDSMLERLLEKDYTPGEEPERDEELIRHISNLKRRLTELEEKILGDS